jgi:hypothetical protein
MSGCINWTTLAIILIGAFALLAVGLSMRAALQWGASRDSHVSLPLPAAPPQRVRRVIGAASLTAAVTAHRGADRLHHPV